MLGNLGLGLLLLLDVNQAIEITDPDCVNPLKLPWVTNLEDFGSPNEKRIIPVQQAYGIFLSQMPLQKHPPGFREG